MDNGAVDPQFTADRRLPCPAHHARSIDSKEILFRFNAIRHRGQENLQETATHAIEASPALAMGEYVHGGLL